MGVYKKAVITEAGEALVARAVSGEVTIQFSNAVTSSYTYSEGKFKKADRAPRGETDGDSV